MGVAVLISMGQLTPREARERLVAGLEERLAETRAELERVRRLPDTIVLGG